ncbi:MAG TPA: hypothetical protein VFM18_11450 [Methanosarcina sp.]|nr:hypothetical protein [Methanosarcina sp.]
MMKLFVAIVSWSYEGYDIIGIFDTREKAQAACDRHKYSDGTWRGDERLVNEYELNEDSWNDE